MAKNATPTALKRWSCSNTQLPMVERVKRVHVYDFDNTLFMSPLPNRQLWNNSTYGALQSQDFLYNGGWWHNPDILAATGQGLAKEEAMGWEGCWNEKIVELARLTAEDDEALGVLLTGRGEARFSGLLQRILSAKGLQFDMVCLKPAVSPHGARFDSTLQFKTALLEEIMETYKQAQEVRMYEDRPKHTKAFSDFFAKYNSRLSKSPSTSRPPFDAEVVQVTEADSTMDPVAEMTAVQKMVNTHNKALLEGEAPSGTPPYKLSRNVLFTGYLTTTEDTKRLRSLVEQSVSTLSAHVKWLGNNILIAPRPAQHNILQKVGGIGASMRWRATARGQLDRRLWAIKVEPAIPGSQVYTENRPPFVVVATSPMTKPIEASRISNWQPLSPSEMFEFETTVGERAILRIDEERPEDEYAEDDDYVPINGTRKHGRDDDFPPLGPSRSMPRSQQRSTAAYNNNQAWNTNRSGGGGGGNGFAAQRGNRHASRGDRRRGNERSGRARGGGRGAYRSLDASVGQGYNPSAMEY